MGRASAALIAVAAALVAAVVLSVAARRGGDAPALAGQLQTDLRAAAAAVHARTGELGALPTLAAALATDAATVRDLTADELALAPRADEIVELAQRWKSGHMVTLLRRPEAAPWLASDDGPGAQLRVAEGRLYAVETRLVQPAERGDELTGVVAVARAVDLEDVRARLRDGGGRGRARLVVGHAALELGVAPLGDAAEAATVLPLDGETRLLVAAPARTGLWAGGGLALGVALAFAGLAARGRGRVAATGVGQGAAAMGVAATGVPATGLTGAGAAAARSITGVSAAAGGAAPMLGRYEIVRRLGRGGMAEVHLARATGEAGFAKTVALKVLLPEHAADPVAVDHFLDEARLAAQLIHPHIVQIADLGRAGDAYFIAMEYVDGTDLARLLDGCRATGLRVPTDIGLALLRQICAGLHAAHTAVAADGTPLGLIHRDVKSANVLVAQSGIAKVGDFGIAKARETVRRTMLGEVKGTAEYMAPEQRAGGEIDARADQYSVGAIAYELFSGQMINLDLARLAHLGQQGWPHLPPLGELRSDLPPELGACVFRVLSYDPAARYASCAELEEALEGLAQAHGLMAGERALATWMKETLPRLGIAPGSDVTAAPSPRRTAAYGHRPSSGR